MANPHQPTPLLSITYPHNLTYPTFPSQTPCPNAFPLHLFQVPHQTTPVAYPPAPCHKAYPYSKCIPPVKDILQHLSTLDPLPSSSVMPEKLSTPTAPQLALTLPVTLEEFECESPPQQHDSSLESDCNPSYPDSTMLTISYMLQPRLPVTYNEAALRCLNGRPQVSTLNFLLIPILLCSNDESTTSNTDASTPAEAEADSPCQQDKSLTSSTRHGHTLTSSGDVLEQPSSAQDPLLAEVHSRSQQCAKDNPETMRHPPDQLKQSNNQGTRQVIEDTPPVLRQRPSKGLEQWKPLTFHFCINFNAFQDQWTILLAISLNIQGTAVRSLNHINTRR